jgi:acyl-CoA thioesterase-1
MNKLLNMLGLASASLWIAMTLLMAASFPAWAKDAADGGRGERSERIMVFGDSLSAAYGISPREGWVALMETALKARNIEVINASISGETTRGGLGRIEADLKRHRPTVVLIALGANDGLRGLPVADMKRNIEAMIAAATAARVRVVLAGVQIPPNYGIEYAENFRNVYPLLAKQYKLALVPFLLDGIAEKLELFQPDRLHPIAAAQPKILENVMPAVNAALKAKIGNEIPAKQAK